MVCASGTLGQIIPPSTLLIILSDVVSNSYQQAQYEQGKFAIDTISVGQVFAAALLPGLAIVVLYILYILLRGMIRPQDMPVPEDLGPKPSLSSTLSAILPAMLLILAVLGTILTGVASPTEAASVGGLGAILMAAIKSGTHRKTLLLGAICLLLLGVAAGVYPVRLQRSDLSHNLALMGQSLFAHPSVKGWDGGESWISTQSLMRRSGILTNLTRGNLRKTNDARMMQHMPNCSDEELITWLLPVTPINPLPTEPGRQRLVRALVLDPAYQVS